MEQVNDEAKMKILIAAKRLFASKGFYKTSIREICREANVHIMMHAYNFQRKENVLSALFQVYMPLKNIRTDNDLPRDPVVSLKRIIREIVTIRVNDPEIISILQHEITLPNPRHDIIQYIVIPVWSELKEQLLLGKMLGIFKFDSIDITMLFIISSILMPRQWDFFKSIIQVPLLDIDLMSDMMNTLILGALRYGG